MGAQAGAANPGLAVCLVCDLFFGPQFSHNEMRSRLLDVSNQLLGAALDTMRFIFNVI